MNLIHYRPSLTRLCSGVTFPLVSANDLADYIIGTVLEACDIEAVISKYGPHMVDRIHNQGATVEDVADEMRTKLQSEGVKMNKFTVENIYTNTPESLHNMGVWSGAENLAAGRIMVNSVSPLIFVAISIILNHIRSEDPIS